jgi:RND family efflux transporter MFP subunit
MQTRSRRLIGRPTFWISLAGLGTLSIVLTTCVSGCGRNAATAQGEPRKGTDAATVATVNPKLETIRRLIEQPGYVSSYEETPIYTRLAGYLENVRVDIGDKLKKGESLCKIWVPEVKEDVAVKGSKIEQAKADIVQAKAILEVAKANVNTWRSKVEEARRGVDRAISDLDRWEKEYAINLNNLKSKIGDKQTVDEALNQWNGAQAKLKEATANRDAAMSSLKESEATRDRALANVEESEAKLGVCEREYKEELAWYGYHDIRAPYDGIVTDRNVHTWHFVQPSNSGTTSKGAAPLFMFMRTDQMRIIIQVPEYDAPLVKVGADAIVKIQALRKREVNAQVTRSSWMLNPESRTLRVEIDVKNPLDNPQEELKSGMYVNVRIKADLPNVMTLPLDAIQTEGSDNFIFVVENGKAKRVSVKLGAANDRLVQLLSKAGGTNANDETEWSPFTGKETVIVSHLENMKDGQSVATK